MQWEAGSDLQHRLSGLGSAISSFCMLTVQLSKNGCGASAIVYSAYSGAFKELVAAALLHMAVIMIMCYA